MRALFRKRHLTLRSLVRAMLLGTLVWGLCLLLLQGDSSLEVLAAQQQEVAQLQAVVDDLREGIGTIKAEMHAFNTDEYVLEKLAREQLGMGRSGETVYVLE